MTGTQRTILISIFAFLSFVFLLRYALLGQAVYGDGIYYFSYVRSITKDKNLNFINEFEHRYDKTHNNQLQETDNDKLKPNTKTGGLENKYPIGAPLIWLPTYNLIDNTANTFRLLNPNFPNNGYSDLYQIGIGLLNIILICLGIYSLIIAGNRYFKEKVVNIGVVAIALGSNLFYYSAIDVINSHPASFLISSLIFLLITDKRLGENKWSMLGFLCGLIALIRTQDIIFLIIPIAIAILERKNIVKHLIIVFLSFFAVFSLQLISWKIIYGQFLAFPYISSKEGFSIFHPHIIEMLTNYKNGLLFWSPFYVLSFIGLLLFRSKHKTDGTIFIAFFLCQFLLISMWSGWSQGEAFGTRMLISTLPFLFVGFLQLITYIKSRSIVYLITAALILFNFSAIFYFLIIVQGSTYNLGDNTQHQLFNRVLNKF